MEHILNPKLHLLPGPSGWDKLAIRAEALLLDASHRPNYCLAVLSLVTEPSVDQHIQLVSSLPKAFQASDYVSVNGILGLARVFRPGPYEGVDD
ncbi:hypothetical protein FEM48_ZijujUnG0073400 [Ziziphus jujuba var. spinosa]|uniref:Uncharacterized protein n=1 Tax=Ziziphus jujuba var. spinosa TaxID=714518 RepID=A0A978U8U8_ZIZJJ|nr:hypothetical protein FEM48_ZijujUnG0073400 [Ziziphus jujuba var. spinosa]